MLKTVFENMFLFGVILLGVTMVIGFCVVIWKGIKITCGCLVIIIMLAIVAVVFLAAIFDGPIPGFSQTSFPSLGSDRAPVLAPIPKF